MAKSPPTLTEDELRFDALCAARWPDRIEEVIVAHFLIQEWRAQSRSLHRGLPIPVAAVRSAELLAETNGLLAALGRRHQAKLAAEAGVPVEDVDVSAAECWGPFAYFA